MSGEPEVGPARDHYSTSAAPDVWWEAHFERAAGEIVQFFADDQIDLAGKRLADIGCGDGITDLGVAVLGKPERLVGFDLMDTDVADLSANADKFGKMSALPDNLFFAKSGETSLPADDDSFDVVFSWSAFEHIADPVGMLREIRRVLTPQGALFIQVWPFFDTAHGPHLVDWFPEGFAHHRLSDDEIISQVRHSGDQRLASEMIEVFHTLNRISADDLHAALRKAGFRTVKLELITEGVHIPEHAGHLPFSRVALSGVKLLAIPAEPVPDLEESTSTLDTERQAVETADAERLAAEEARADAEARGRAEALSFTAAGRLAHRARQTLRRLDEKLTRWDPSGQD
ncbi:MAG TPA: class I SAM-dependent methyltransferase [Jatrophihabitantaceae bacterium]|jgi:ubiquinone/menaquinone biosynthesis C-methylase UbiE